MPHDPQPQWQPIRALPTLAYAIDGMLEAVQENRVSLEQARSRPYILDNATIDTILAKSDMQVGLDYLMRGGLGDEGK